MREDIENACDEIDAALFSGDYFHEQKTRLELREYLERWTTQLDVIQQIEINEEVNDDINEICQEGDDFIVT